MTMSQLMRFIDALPTGALSSGSGIAWEEETAKFSQPVLLPKSAVSFPLSSTLAFGIPDQLDHCRANLLHRVATRWSLLYGSHFEVNDGG